MCVWVLGRGVGRLATTSRDSGGAASILDNRLDVGHAIKHCMSSIAQR